MEYVLHRFLLHRDILLDPEEPWTEKGGERNATYFQEHIHHHVFMNQKYRIALNVKLYIFWMPFIAGVGQLLINYCGWSVRICYMIGAGWTSGSLCYDGLHLAMHFEEMYQPPFAWF